MPILVRIKQRVVSLIVALVAVAAVGGVAVSSASAIGKVSPRNPARNCDTGQVNELSLTIKSIDRCRTKEGVGPMDLPSNYSKLTVSEQMLVVINLERINRGLSPIVGLSRTLNSYAQHGADRENDPGFPHGGFYSGGALWAWAWGVLGADLGWMYDDGWGGPVSNLDCTGPHASGCWGHRDIILMHAHQPLVAGAGAKKVPSGQPGIPPAHSYAFEILSGYSTKHLVFRWSSELKYFTARPAREPKQKHK